MAYLGTEPFIPLSAAWFPAPHNITSNVLTLLEERHQSKVRGYVIHILLSTARSCWTSA